MGFPERRFISITFPGASGRIGRTANSEKPLTEVMNISSFVDL
jgi:hypothetical protein